MKQQKKVVHISVRLLFFISIVSYQTTWCATKIIACGIPKCGSNLLAKLVGKITQKERYGVTGLAITNNSYLENINLRSFDWQNRFLSTHTMAFQDTLKYFKDNNFKIVFIYRDPRDQVISMMHFVKNFTLFPELHAISDNNIFIKTWITDTAKICYGPWELPGLKDILKGIDSFYACYFPWFDSPQTYCASFENLIGSKGGGSDQVQLQEIMKIAQHINHPIPLDTAKKIAGELHGNSPTFREGKIGSWKEYFKPEHIKLFKDVAGELLIKLGYEKDNSW